MIVFCVFPVLSFLGGFVYSKLWWLLSMVARWFEVLGIHCFAQPIVGIVDSRPNLAVQSRVFQLDLFGMLISRGPEYFGDDMTPPEVRCSQTKD